MIQMLSLFSGIGAFEKALENNGVDFNIVNYSEIDNFASKAYAILHNVSESKNLGDITKIDASQIRQHIDLCSYGFPCQDISIAGDKNGFFRSDGSYTRSGLFFEALRIINTVRPDIAIAENVKNLTSKSMKPVFDLVLKSLDDAGYNNYYQILNAADYGLPQSRERVIIVSIRKDVDNGNFRFPDPVKLTTCMADYLDDDVPDSYYLSSDKTASVIRHDSLHKGHMADINGVCPTLLARDYKDPKVVCV